MATDKELRTGDIVGHRFRKQGVYLLIKEGPQQYHMVRVKKQVGYPIASKGRYVERDPSKLHVVVHVVEYEKHTKEDCLRHKHRDPNAGQSAHLEPISNPDDCPAHIFAKFLTIAGNLSPEMLYCDGEASISYVRSMRNQLNKEWRALEELIQFSVSVDWVWETYLNDPARGRL